MSFQKLFTSSEAPIKSMSASVSSLTIKVLRTRANPPPLPRAPDFNAGSTFTCAAFHAGNKPKSKSQVKIVPAEKIKTGTSTPISSMRAITSAPITLNAATAKKASSTPSAPPIKAMRSDSLNNKRTICQRDPPTARRTATSRSRVACAGEGEVGYVRARDQQNENRASRGDEQRFAFFTNEIAKQGMNFDRHTGVRRRILRGQPRGDRVHCNLASRSLTPARNRAITAHGWEARSLTKLSFPNVPMIGRNMIVVSDCSDRRNRSSPEEHR